LRLNNHVIYNDVLTLTTGSLKSEMNRRLLLYTRRGNIIRGPFPSKQITRHVLLGRLKITDAVSTDQINWKTIADFPELIPEELLSNGGNLVAKDKLKLARYREDERLSGDRRDDKRSNDPNDKRRSSNRRQSESFNVQKHREVKTKIFNEGKKNSKYISIKNKFYSVCIDYCSGVFCKINADKGKFCSEV